MSTIHYSIVIPIYNEADNIQKLTDEIEWVMDCHKDHWELIFINDGSTDRTKEVLDRICRKCKSARVIHLKGRCGQTAAITAGVRDAKGTWIISLDGDMQNDPRDIPFMINTCHRGSEEYDMVCGIRRLSRFKRFMRSIGNFLRRLFLDDKTTDSRCSLKICRKEALDTIPLFKRIYYFLPALFQIAGYSVYEVPVHHRKRSRGKSKYSLFNRRMSFFDLLAVYWMKKRYIRYEIEKDEIEKTQ